MAEKKSGRDDKFTQALMKRETLDEVKEMKKKTGIPVYVLFEKAVETFKKKEKL